MNGVEVPVTYYGWTVVAVQEVQDMEALKLICDSLNKPNLRRVVECKSNSKQWTFCMSDLKHSQLGFLYDTCSKHFSIGLNSLGQTNIEDCQVALADFKIGNTEVALLNVHLPISESNNIEEKFKQSISTEENIFFAMGDFTSFSKNVVNSNEIVGLQAVLPFSTNTNSVNIKSNINNRFVDNILTNKGGQAQLTGVWGVVRQGLTHLAIPCGWNWGGPVSTHCPVWAEIYVSPNIGTAL